VVTQAARRPLGWLCVVAGVALALFGAALTFLFGPDNRLASGPHAFSSAGAAIVTAPAALDWTGATVEVTAVSEGRAVFVGLADDVDVRDYLADTSYTRIDDIDVPWHADTSAVEGSNDVDVVPTDADFWLVKGSGDDEVTVRFPLPDAAVDLVVMDADGKPDFQTDLTMALVRDGAFVSGLALLVIGLGVGVAGLLLLRRGPRRGRRRAAGGRRTTTATTSGTPGRRRRGRRAARVTAAATVTLLLAGCGVPHHRSVEDVSKPGATLTEADAVLGSYVSRRNAAEQDLGAGALADIEQGTMLDIDQSAFAIRGVLGIDGRPLVVGDNPTVWASRFDEYPLWFVALVTLPQEKQQAAYVFRRATSTSPWRVAAAPHLADSTKVPRVDEADDGTVARYVDGDPARWSDGASVDLDTSPQDIADAYADVLTDDGSPHADEFVEDSFIAQMRQIRKAQPRKGVTFDQEWKAEPVDYVLRLADGGALMLVDLHRLDIFRVNQGKALKFGGSEAGAYLPDPITDVARLRYAHQVLMVVPAEGQPLVIGQYGGLVSAQGH
jgi:hypothetical protein